MRQKRIKNATIETLKAGGVITELEMIDTSSYEHVYLEIGSGKGQFITSLAKDHKDALWVAMEVNINVCYRILEKKEALELNNLIIILGDANHILAYFKPQHIDGLFLNFSDPWPKAKHHKRRLTYPSFLKQYQTILKKDAIIQFRTDHKDLFDDSLDYARSTDFELIEVNKHLEKSQYMTEYEEKKRQDGPIYQFKAREKR
ncbi:MAG: tRNA (guanosine(46)-N7)-methyltransferase TrmB [Acholeplasmataceae bacterium]